MKKYFLLAAVFAFFGIFWGAGFAASAGLCIVAAAIAERQKSVE